MCRHCSGSRHGAVNPIPQGTRAGMRLVFKPDSTNYPVHVEKTS